LNSGDEARLGIIPEKPLSGTIASIGIAGRGFFLALVALWAYRNTLYESEKFTEGVQGFVSNPK
jgi:hypothetical protein